MICSLHKISRLGRFTFLTMLLCIFVLHSEGANAQQKRVDSLSAELSFYSKSDTQHVILLKKIADGFRSVNMDSSIYYAEECISLAKEQDFKSGLATGYNALGNTCEFVNDIDRAIESFEKAIQLYQELDNLKGELAVTQNLSNVYARIGKMDKSIEMQEETQRLSIEMGDTLRFGMIANDLGRNYMNINQPYKAFINLKYAYLIGDQYGHVRLKGSGATNMASLMFVHERYEYGVAFAKDATEIFKKDDFKVGLGASEGILGSLFLRQKRYDEAIAAYERAINYSTKIGDKRGAYNRLNNIAVLYFELDSSDLAFDYFRKAADIYDGSYVTNHAALSLGNLAAIYVERGEIDSGLYYGEKSLAMYEKLGNPQGNLTLNLTLSKANELSNRYKEAFHFANLARMMSDSINEVTCDETMNKLEVDYDVESKRRQVDTLQLDNNLKREELKSGRLYLLISILSFVLILALIFMYLLNQKAKAKRKNLEMEQMVLRAQMNPHFIFNSLNSIQRLYIEGNTDKASDFLVDFSQLLRAILENNTKATIPLNEELKYLDMYCKMERLRTDGQIEYRIENSLEMRASNVRIPPMIIQPFVENAIWHGILPKKEKGTVAVKINHGPEGYISISVTDDGVGWKSESNSKHQSKGIMLIESRIKQKIKIEQPEKGTRISFNVKIK